VIAAVTGKPISIYGDGKQVRDVLYVDDLLDAYDASLEQIDQAAGKVYNVGGGPENTISVWEEFGPMLEESLGHALPIRKDDWRPAISAFLWLIFIKPNRNWVGSRKSAYRKV
jgi:CDP-paratose 2-epimerase